MPVLKFHFFLDFETHAKIQCISTLLKDEEVLFRCTESVFTSCIFKIVKQSSFLAEGNSESLILKILLRMY